MLIYTAELFSKTVVSKLHIFSSTLGFKTHFHFDRFTGPKKIYIYLFGLQFLVKLNIFLCLLIDISSVNCLFFVFRQSFSIGFFLSDLKNSLEMVIVYYSIFFFAVCHLSFDKAYLVFLVIAGVLKFCKVKYNSLSVISSFYLIMCQLRITKIFTQFSQYFYV